MDLKDKKIIIVEDNMLNQYLLKSILKTTNADLTFCENADEFFEKYTNEHDIILLDIQLPGGRSGKDILKELKNDSKTANIPVIMQTAYEEEKYTCAKLGADDFITKPVMIAKLFGSIKKLLKLDES